MELNYRQYGSQGPHLIILHGLFGMLDNWHTLAGRFGEEFRTWILDLRNHGKSPHSEDFNYDIVADDLWDFCKQQQIGQAHVLGHSMGGKAAMQFAFHYPDKINRLVVADIAPRGYESRHDNILEALQSVDLSKMSRRQEADEALARYIAEPGVRQFLLKNLNREGEAFRWKMNLPALVAHYEEISGPVDPWGQFTGPALFVKGERSTYILKEDESDILRQFPQAQFAVIPGAGHWLHADAPDAFFDTVVDFLK